MTACQHILSLLTEAAFDDLLALARILTGASNATIAFNGNSKTWGTPANIDMPVSAEVPILDKLGVGVGALKVFGNQMPKLTAEQDEALALIAGLIAERIRKRVDSDAFDKQQEFFNNILESITDGVVACDEHEEVTYLNRATRELYGVEGVVDIKPEQWGDYFRIFQADGKTPMNMTELPLSRSFRGEILTNLEMVVEHKDGKRLRLLYSGRAIYDRQGKKLGAMINVQDITDTSYANARLLASEKMLQAVIDNCPVGIAVLDAEETIKMFNPAAEKLFGWDKADIVGRRPQYRDEAHREQIQGFMNQVRKNKTVMHDYPKKMRKDGTPFDMHQITLPLLDENNEIYGFMSTFTDVSAIKQREANLVESNRVLEAASKAKSEFLANMSHEIRTPLNGVIGMTELVLLSQLTTEQREQLKTVQVSAHNLLAIISDILDFSKIEAGKLDVENLSFDPEKIVTDVNESLALSAHNRGLRLVKTVNGPVGPFLMGDEGRIRQVLTNLLSNAIKFSKNGEVHTTLAFTPRKNGRVAMKVSVRDFGVGIPEETLARLFQPFSQADSSTTRRFGGTGLGLSISKRLVDLMGGRIGLESQANVGSTFWFSLELERAPVKENKAPARAMISVTDTDIKSRARILLAEDNLVNQKVAMYMLNNLGYSASVVSNGQAAIELLKQEDFDLVLMDCQMPTMDGFEATRAIRSQPDLPNNIKIIAVTANSMKGDREKCLEAGMDDYIPKPLRLEDLDAMLARYLLKRPTAIRPA